MFDNQDRARNMASSPQPLKGKLVYTADNMKVGSVSAVDAQAGYFVAQKGVLVPHDLYIPLSAIVTNSTAVALNLTKETLKDPRFTAAPTASARPTAPAVPTTPRPPVRIPLLRLFLPTPRPPVRIPLLLPTPRLPVRRGLRFPPMTAWPPVRSLLPNRVVQHHSMPEARKLRTSQSRSVKRPCLRTK